MIKIVLTGSIGMGKSTTAKLFAEQGIPVFDADATVHSLYAKKGAAIKPVSIWIPNVIRDGAIDRALLGAHLATNPQDFSKLESIVHPLVSEMRETWTNTQKERNESIVLYDIPLFYEGKSKILVDFVVLVSAPYDIQKKRVMARSGMTHEKWKQITARQMPDARKRKKSDYMILTDRGIPDARLQVTAVLRHIGPTLGHGIKNRRNTHA